MREHPLQGGLAVADETIEQIDAVRRFNRFYTRHVGALDEHLLSSPFTLAEARVVFELGVRLAPTASAIGDALGLDRGYLSRIVQKLARQGLVKRERSSEDGRRIALSLTTPGRRAFRSLDRRSSEATKALIATLPLPQRARMLEAMRIVQATLGPPRRREFTIRDRRIGDVGWAIEAHARAYADQYGWNDEFEALVATLFARLASNYDPARMCVRIAELEGERVGCVFVVPSEGDPRIAQLRCLLVTPAGRGMGIGRRLVDECLQFAASAGYCGMMLWTNDILIAARLIYQAVGFRLTEQSPHHSFGHDLVGQTWVREF